MSIKKENLVMVKLVSLETVFGAVLSENTMEITLDKPHTLVSTPEGAKMVGLDAFVLGGNGIDKVSYQKQHVLYVEPLSTHTTALKAFSDILIKKGFMTEKAEVKLD